MHTQTPPSAFGSAAMREPNRMRDRKSAKVKYGRAHLARSLLPLTKLMNAFSYLQAGFLNSVPAKVGPRCSCIYAKCVRALI
jgi:hypothetical protein